MAFQYGAWSRLILGLLLFFLPGVIAFAVDFTTGAIYLPATAMPAALLKTTRWLKYTCRGKVAQARVEEVASQHSGRDVRLVAGTYKTSPLTKLSEFWSTRHTLITGRA